MTNLTERKLKACQVKPIDAVPYSEELQALKEENARLKERDKIYSELAENLLCIEEEKWCDLVENGTKEQRIDFLREKEKHSILSAIDKISKLKGLLYIINTPVLEQGSEQKTKEIHELLTKIEEALK